jgi:hypothetical protein
MILARTSTAHHPCGGDDFHVGLEYLPTTQSLGENGDVTVRQHRRCRRQEIDCREWVDLALVLDSNEDHNNRDDYCWPEPRTVLPPGNDASLVGVTDNSPAGSAHVDEMFQVHGDKGKWRP